MDKERSKNILFDLFEEYDEYEDIVDSLRSLNSCNEIVNDEYDYLLKNYDKLLEEWLIKKEKDKDIKLSKLDYILDDLLTECKNETIESENVSELTDKELEMIYYNVELFIAKLKDRIIEEVL